MLLPRLYLRNFVQELSRTLRLFFKNTKTIERRKTEQEMRFHSPESFHYLPLVLRSMNHLFERSLALLCMSWANEWNLIANEWNLKDKVVFHKVHSLKSKSQLTFSRMTESRWTFSCWSVALFSSNRRPVSSRNRFWS